MQADGRTAASRKAGEVVIVNAAVVDARGRPVPTADNLLRFSATGGEVIGVGNGNPNSLEPDVATRAQGIQRLCPGDRSRRARPDRHVGRE